MTTTTVTNKEVYEDIYKIWLEVNKLGNGYPHGCEEWKAFSKKKREIRKKLWELMNI